MVLKIWIAGTEINLSELEAPINVAVMTGTYDPIHQGHLQTAQNVLESHETAGYQPVDLFLFAPHSLNPGKKPSPLEVRIAIIQELIKNKSRLGVITSPSKERHAAREFFELLAGENSGVTYYRVIGSDKVSIDRAELAWMVHLISPRQIINGVVAPPIYLLPPNSVGMSSTQIRNGDILLGEEYKPIEELIKTNYPQARIKH